MDAMDAILLDALERHYEGQIAYHRANINVYLKNSVGIGEHPDIMEALSSSMSKLAEADEGLETLRKYFR
tara:strand:+ start:30257 stop:30466 length:210 start_codon:yes stop_codon:yes gene_type:complete